MLSVTEALRIVLDRAKPLPADTVALGDALGLVLCEDIASDLDMPPFDKAMMDGFALRIADLQGGRAELAIIEEIVAGKTPGKAVGPNQAARIMTGAPMPPGADTVVMIERCETAGDIVRVNDPKLQAGANILPRGREMHIGETVLSAGTRLRPQEVGLLAAVGRWSVRAQRRPTVGVLCTGDELVPAENKPGPGQIRNSNGPMLTAQIQRAGGVPRFVGIARDEPAHLRERIADGLRSDMLLLSGGVSAGKLDLVPGVLAELGVEPLFHKVAIKPGKPLLFGMHGPRLVFGLPGNPGASLVCFEMFVRPALRGLMGLPPGPRIVTAVLVRDFPYRSDRPTYHPARLILTDTGWTVDPVGWFGSPDLRGTVPANAFVILPEGDHQHRAGARLPVLRVEDEE